MPSISAPLRELGESQHWQRGPWRCTVEWRDDRLHLTIPAVGRDQDYAVDSAQDAWVDAAARGFPEVERVYTPDWTLPPEVTGPLARALGIETFVRHFRAPAWHDALLVCFEDKGSLMFTWGAIWNARALSVELDANGAVWVRGAPLPEPLAGPLGNPEASALSTRAPRETVLERARVLAAWSPETLLGVTGYASLHHGG
jgi:hypothetical protein